jgi:hypothetical protein
MHQHHHFLARLTCLFVTLLLLVSCGVSSEIIPGISKRTASGIEAGHARLQGAGNGGCV